MERVTKKFKNSMDSIKGFSIGKKITIIFSFLLIIAAAVVTPMMFAQKNHDIQNWSYGTIENDGKYTNSLLLEDSKVKTNENNKDNVSVYYVQGIGIFVTTQIMISLVKQLELYPQKEIVILITERVAGETVGLLPWDDIANKYPTVRVEWMDGSGTTEDEETPTYSGFEKEIIDNLKPGQKFDLYTNTFSYYKNMINTFADEWKDSFVHMNSMNFFSEGASEVGTHYVTVEEYLENNLIYKDDIIKYNNEKWPKLLAGEDVEYDGVKLSHTLGVSPDIDGDGENEFNYFSLSDQYYIYENTGRTNYLNQQSVGFEEVWNTMTLASEDTIRKFYKVGAQEQYIGEENIIYVGDLMNSEANFESQKKMILDLYEKHDVENNLLNTNILFKPHPRQDTPSSNGEHWLERLKTELEAEHPSTDEWYGVVQKETPIEMFAITQHFRDDTNTSYKYYVNGSSSAVAALFEAGVDQNNIEGYVFKSQGSLNGAIGNWGIDGYMIPFDDLNKIVKLWEVGNE